MAPRLLENGSTFSIMAHLHTGLWGTGAVNMMADGVVCGVVELEL